MKDSRSEGEAKPYVSFVISAYSGNNSEWLRLAIESVFRQSLKNCELVLAVDGPVPEDVQAVLGNAERVGAKVVNLSVNLGPAAARNAGVRASEGKYVAILDADDVALPERAAKQVSFLERHPEIDVVGSHYFEIDERGHRTGQKESPIGVAAVSRFAGLFNPINNSTVMGKREIFLSNPYPEMRWGEDYRLWVTLLKEGYRISNINNYLVEFRVGDRFFAERRGWKWAASDFRTKLRAATLTGNGRGLFVVLVAIITFLLRMLPASLIRVVYDFKKKWLRRQARGTSVV